MPTNTPRLGLPKGLGTDNSRDYLKGAIAGGGLWHALEVLDDALLQSASNTLNNATLNNPTINGWTNAQHTHASAATAGSTLGPGTTLSSPTLSGPGVTGTMTFTDATLQRTGVGALRADTNLGVGVNPAAWGSGYNATQVGQQGAWWGTNAGAGAYLSQNVSFDGTNRRALATGAATEIEQSGAQLNFKNAPSVAAGAAQTFTTRASIGGTGTLTLQPDGGVLAVTTTGILRLGATSDLYVQPASGVFAGGSDNAVSCGHTSVRWTYVAAVNGTIQTSSADAKRDITPLDPQEAMAAVRNTTPCVFDYLPPERPAEWYELPDDPEAAEAVLYQRLVSGPLEEAARHQHGVVLNDPAHPCADLFQTGQGQTNPSNSVGVLLAAIKQLDQRVSALGG